MPAQDSALLGSSIECDRERRASCAFCWSRTKSRLAEMVRRGLVAEGFVVDVEHDGLDGLAAATAGDFDVVVLDIMLPGLSGYQVVRELRARQVWTPVLMLSAKDGEYDLADAFDLGADDYLTKPFSFVVLVARLRALLRRGAPQRPTVLTAGTLSLDPARRRVTRGEDGARPDSARVRTAGIPFAQQGRRGDQDQKFCGQCGTRTTTATTMSSRSISAICGARSTSRSGWSPSKRCVASVTDSSPMPSPNLCWPNHAVRVAV